jgi:hypothetical protein
LEYHHSNLARTLAHSLNIDLKDTGDKVGSIPIAPGIMKFKIKEQPPWDDGQWDHGTVKWYEIIDIGERSAKVREVTGKCDHGGMNTQNVMTQCSTTSGQEFTISGEQLDWLMAHIAGQPAGGGMGGPMGGGMLSPMASSPPPPTGGGATPPPPPPTGGTK